VFRWERDWEEPGRPFRDPAGYPAASVATSGTHDTETLAAWWDEAPAEERQAVLAVPSIARRTKAADAVHAVLGALFGSGSALLILPIQDVFGWRDRINRPATVGGGNWTWKLPWPSDQLTAEPRAGEVARQLAAWSVESGRV
jgi:4-alpha-glucanotransferase